MSARPRAVLLTIAYEGDRLELVAQQSVTMKVPRSDPVEGPRAAQAGFWVDLKDSADRTLYRRLLQEPMEPPALAGALQGCCYTKCPAAAERRRPDPR
ncbi:MAG TPA: hypothetical protein VF121_13580 [Thermoanaerobaculia bacterium]|nr:hypothetical protein [Thermoanaerobaculia bacterium]